MKSNFDLWLSEVLKHEGGFVDHPKDPGGATNKGITIGTLKRLKIDVDGDGDSDLADLKKLRHSDVARVYRLFYWDAVRGDLLPSGLDFCVADFAVNSGVSRAVQHLQRALGVTADGDLGPRTMAALEGADVARLINKVCDSRLAFMKQARHRVTKELLWPQFKNGWSRRVAEVRALSLAHVNKTPKPEHVAPSPQEVSTGRAGFWAWLVNLIMGKR